MKKVFSASIDVYGGRYNGDAGTLYVVAESLKAAEAIIRRTLKIEVTCVVGNLRENQLPAKYWPSETYRILGESEGLLFPVDEKAEEAQAQEAIETYKNAQMEALFEEEDEKRFALDAAKIKKGVYVSWAAFDIARIGRDQMYEKAQEAFMQEHTIEVEINEMSIAPINIIGEYVEYLCVPIEYKLVG